MSFNTLEGNELKWELFPIDLLIRPMIMKQQ